MRNLLCGAALALVASSALASGISDANAGLDALNKYDYGTAVRLLTRAITVGKLKANDQELAYVTRARAYIGQHMNQLALADLDKASKLDPNDRDIGDLRYQAMGIPPGPNLAEAFAAIQEGLSAQGQIK